MTQTTDQPWDSFAEFLANAPPSSTYTGMDCVETVGRDHWEIQVPEITTHCNQDCKGVRPFDGKCDGDRGISGLRHVYFGYSCRTCQKAGIILPLLFESEDWYCGGKVVKIGQWPRFGPPIPAKLQRIIQEDRDLFLKGHLAESLGLGVGAYTYYRRVVEKHKDSLLNEILKVAKRTKAPGEVLTAIEEARTEQQFSKLGPILSRALPDALKYGDINPLTLLYKPLSQGIHGLTDEQCLEKAQDIRTVLVAFAEQISDVLKNQKELEAAAKRLAKGT